ncbi:NADH:flavin oxidoreductase/NADH oxidase [Campylobacter sp. US33a]|uniref:NADH:flavin oxidoreductase/NADH oxidase n=1 Tax=Campylobacter sp. US33a TaxID=2498120 RepID=UPI001068BBEE|nr:NADH:flavin oxidoreductase/NADH oxidase [Campylobacter sp. US33a]TEY02000.1 NADH:flavin oxidoreductase/NADH oxidase [Campylobacter sp. US33a]
MSLLLSPLKIANFTVKNRIVMPPMDTYQAQDGMPNVFHLNHYGARAMGGVGLIIVEANAICAEGKISDQDLGIYSDEHITKHKSITDICHHFGAKIALQLNHSGRKNGCKNATQLAPSDIKYSDNFANLKVLDKKDIEKICQDFCEAAKRAKLANYDAVEIHAAHGYLISSFLSPLSNQRTDEFGGSFENRIRLLCDIVKGIKERVDIPIFVRISASEWEEKGWDLEQSKKLALVLENLGIYMLDISAGGNINKPSLVPNVAPLYQANYAKELKRILKIPVSCVGLITSASEGEALLLGEVCDLVCYGRELLRNPNFAYQAAKILGEKDKIHPSYIRAY